MKTSTILSIIGLAAVMLLIGTALGSIAFPMTKTVTDTSTVTTTVSTVTQTIVNQTSSTLTVSIKCSIAGQPGPGANLNGFNLMGRITIRKTAQTSGEI
jgi:hypothetical protein